MQCRRFSPAKCSCEIKYIFSIISARFLPDYFRQYTLLYFNFQVVLIKNSYLYKYYALLFLEILHCSKSLHSLSYIEPFWEQHIGKNWCFLKLGLCLKFVCRVTVIWFPFRINTPPDYAKIQAKILHQSQKNQILYVFFDAPRPYDNP